MGRRDLQTIRESKGHCQGLLEKLLPPKAYLTKLETEGAEQPKPASEQAGEPAPIPLEAGSEPYTTPPKKQRKQCAAGSRESRAEASLLSDGNDEHDLQSCAAACVGLGRKLPTCPAASGGDFVGVAAWCPLSKVLATVISKFLTAKQVHPCTALQLVASTARIAMFCRKLAEFRGSQLVAVTVCLFVSEWEGVDLTREERCSFLTCVGLQGQVRDIQATKALCCMELGSPRN